MNTRKPKAEAVNEAAASSDDSGIYLDPDLAKIRDEEVKVLRDLPNLAPRGLVESPAIDLALVEAREAEIKRGDRKLV